jgi:hypothetical protein
MKKFLLCGAALMLSISSAQAFDDKMNLEPDRWEKVYYVDKPDQSSAIDIANLLIDKATGDVVGFALSWVMDRGPCVLA